MNKEEITYKLNEMLDFARLSTDIGFIDQTEQIKVLESTLDLIDKLQKENEELIEQRDNAIKLRNEIIEEEKELKEEIENWKFTHKYVEENYVDKDKIRNKIKELKKYPDNEEYFIDDIKEILEELLEEK